MLQMFRASLSIYRSRWIDVKVSPRYVAWKTKMTKLSRDKNKSASMQTQIKTMLDRQIDGVTVERILTYDWLCIAAAAARCQLLFLSETESQTRI